MSDQQQPVGIEFDEDAITNESGNSYIGELIDARLSRRAVLGGGISAGAAMMLGGIALPGSAQAAAPAAPALGFTAVDKSTDDFVHIPAGYTMSVLYALGDPINDTTPAWAGDGSETADSYNTRAGDHHDAIAYFGAAATGNQWDANNSDEGYLVMNHEALTTIYLHQNYDGNAAPRNAEQALKEMNAHGVSVVKVKRGSGGAVRVVRKDKLNRRITAQTPMAMSGPVRGSRFAVTKYDPSGRKARGTVNNCAHGVTPWGTYLACEENWAGYFGRGATDNAMRSEAEVRLLNRYGISQNAAGRHKWHTAAGLPDTDDRFSRWNTSVLGVSTDGSDDYRNEHNTYGWCVEINPFNKSMPRKRTALGRFAHEGAWFAPAVAGQPLVCYSGDDSRNEYVYKFVSDALWDPADVNGGYAAGDKYLDKGTLYVAKFNNDGSGEWVALKHKSNGLTASNALYPFTSQSAVLIATRLAADAVGATKMDRPEWGGVNPLNGEVYFTMTNNSQRASGQQDAANPRVYDADTGSYTTSQNGNVNGHIIRWREAGSDHAATSFTWDIYVFASRAAYPANVNISALDASNDMSSPDGLWFDPRGLLWIQTDDGAYTQGVAGDSTATNCMMLAAVPGQVGDGSHYDVPTATGTVRTYVGAAPGSNLRRFLVGPKDCEITGVCMTPDHKTMFVNVQHPGEGGSLPPTLSNWPDIQSNPGSTARPRSATIVIRRNDGGEIAVA